MSLSKDKAWFRANTHDHGWRLPARWQRWCALAVLLSVTAGLVYAYTGGIAVFPGVVLIGAGAFAAVDHWKGEAPCRWRRGEDRSARDDGGTLT